MTPVGKKALLLGSGELGKEVAIELQRYGVEVVACDKYANAPAMQVAHRSHVFSMLDAETLEKVVREEKPDHIIPEIEAIATPKLLELEKDGFHVTPTARAAWLTMNREGIRRLAAEELGVKTSPYRFASTKEEFLKAVEEVGIPCVVKPVMSSSGHGQSTIKNAAQTEEAWTIAQEGGRAGAGRVIVEGFVCRIFKNRCKVLANIFLPKSGSWTIREIFFLILPMNPSAKMQQMPIIKRSKVSTLPTLATVII